MSRQIEPVFIDEDGDAIQFYLHESVEDADRDELTGLIQKYGGIVVETDEGVDTVIIDPDYEEAYDLQNAYYVHRQRRYRSIRVEDTTFVRVCIQTRTFQHTPVVRYPMRGNHAGRVNFTKKDEENMCRYLAIKIPDPSSGGRLGHKIYKDLVNLVHVMPDEYQWVTRHPAESWRQHYRIEKNRARLDAMIEQFKNKEQPTEEQLYMYDRKLRFINVGDDSSTDNEPETYDNYWDKRNARRKSKLNRLRGAMMEEDEESSPNEEIPGDEDSAPDDRPSSLFSADEREKEQMEEQTDDTQHVNRTFNEPATSQATLVGNGRSVGPSPIRLPQARERGDQRAVPTEGPVINERNEPQESIDIAEPESLMPPSPQGKRKRGQRVQEPRDNGPYRNTRTRSGSVGLPTTTDLAVSRPAKRGRKKKAIEATQNEESTMEEPQAPPEAPLVFETIAEEVDVEHLLITETNEEGSHVSNAQRQRQRPSFSHSDIVKALDSAEEAEEEERRAEESTLRRQESLETDDEQIDRKLSRPQSMLMKSDHDDLDPMKVLHEFFAPESRLEISPSPGASSSTRIRRQPLQPFLGQEADDDPWRESSAESFPKHGTRASAIKKQGEEKRKKEEYVPPPTSRAARYARRQRGVDL